MPSSTDITVIKRHFDDDTSTRIQERIDNPAVSEKADQIHALYNKYANQCGITDTHYTGTSKFRNSIGGIMINTKDFDGSSYEAPFEVLFHELTHNIDWIAGNRDRFTYMSGHTYEGKRLKDVIKEDYKAYKKQIGAKNVDEFLNMLRTEKLPDTTTGNASDVLEFCTNRSYPLGIGHGVSYHKKSDNATEREFMAEVVSSAITNKESYEYMYRMFPNAIDMLWKMIGDASIL